jgi:hypothetical protein
VTKIKFAATVPILAQRRLSNFLLREYSRSAKIKGIPRGVGEGQIAVISRGRRAPCDPRTSSFPAEISASRNMSRKSARLWDVRKCDSTCRQCWCYWSILLDFRVDRFQHHLSLSPKKTWVLG